MAAHLYEKIAILFNILISHIFSSFQHQLALIDIILNFQQILPDQDEYKNGQIQNVPHADKTSIHLLTPNNCTGRLGLNLYGMPHSQDGYPYENLTTYYYRKVTFYKFYHIFFFLIFGHNFYFGYFLRPP